MPRSLVAALSLSLALVAGCTPRAVIPDSERQRVTAEVSGQQRWLRVALWMTPFWGDGSKVLLTDVPPDQLDLVEDTSGNPIKPPPPERILLPGTALRIHEVEFPSSWIIARRVVMSPRYHPWVFLDPTSDGRTQVIVLSQTAASYDEVRAELERLLSADDPTPVFAALPQDQRDAIGRKELIEGMGLRAVEMAWGLPERRRIDRPASTEEWTWPDGKRKAFFQDERLVRWER